MNTEPGWTKCPKCDADLVEDETKCWLCGEPAPSEAPRAAAIGKRGPRATDSSSFLVVLVSVLALAALALIAPGVAFLLFLLACPALLAIAIEQSKEGRRRRKQARKPLSLLSSLFFAFVALMLAGWAALMALVVALLLVCSVIGNGGNEGPGSGAIALVGIGGALAITVSYFVGKKIHTSWSRRQRSGSLGRAREQQARQERP